MVRTAGEGKPSQAPHLLWPPTSPSVDCGHTLLSPEVVVRVECVSGTRRAEGTCFLVTTKAKNIGEETGGAGLGAGLLAAPASPCRRPWGRGQRVTAAPVHLRKVCSAPLGGPR